MDTKHYIKETKVTETYVDIELKNGVIITLSSNRGYVNVHFSGIGMETPIEVYDQAANQLNIRYPISANH